MAHMIEDGMIAYKGETPWHRLGTAVEDSATGEEMLVAAKMDWPVESLPLPGDKNIPAASLENWRAITRTDTKRVFQVASKIYKPVQNREIVDFFKAYTEAGHATMETVGAINGGATVWALAKLNGGDKVLRGGDQLKARLLLATSHDGSIPTIAKPVDERVVCHNTLMRAFREKSNTFRLIHNQKFDDKAKKQAQEVMGMAIEQVEEINEIADQLSQVRIDADGRLEFVERLILNGGSLLDAVVDAQGEGSVLDQVIAQTQKQSREEREKRIGFIGRAILDAIVSGPGADLESAKDTMWGAVNGVTFYADHGAKAFTHDNRLYNSWFGRNEALKTKAVETAVAMAGLNIATAATR